MSNQIINIINNFDIVNHIYTFLFTVDDKSAVACINKALNQEFKSKSYFAIQHENIRLKQRENKNYDLFICINSECRKKYYSLLTKNILDNITFFNKKRVVGNVYFFYPKKLTRYEDIDLYINSSAYTLVRSCRYEECRKGEKIKRFIPYCELCMHKYVNYGYRHDGELIPFGYSDKYIKNL